jgi:hypothetical protein
MRNYYTVKDGVKTFSSGPYDPFTINRHWNPGNPILLPTDYFQDDSSHVYGLHITWMKSVRGVITNSSIYGSITATSEVQQTVSFEKMEY